jgi:hypothetical protein
MSERESPPAVGGIADHEVELFKLFEDFLILKPQDMGQSKRDSAIELIRASDSQSKEQALALVALRKVRAVIESHK